MTDLARELGGCARRTGKCRGCACTVYPYPHVEAVIPLMAEGLLTPYLDIPFQHASPSVLRAMKRPANEAKVLERLRSWREICPDLAIRSSFVVGFPGETEDDFATCSTGSKKRSSTASARSASNPWPERSPTISPAPCPKRSRKNATPA
jgi:tRNA A37 methylthiotransferase MiaB